MPHAVGQEGDMARIGNLINAYHDNDLKDFMRFLVFKQHRFAKHRFQSVMSWYNKQIFLAQITSAGSGLMIGSNETTIHRFGTGRIIIGEDVMIYTPIMITSSDHIFPEPVVQIGDRTHIGRNSAIRAAKRVSIGNDCLISSYVRIYDYNGHPLAPVSPGLSKALRNRSKTPIDEVGEISIGDNVWIGENAFIQRGVTIGNGAIVAANSVVVKDVPENVVVFGSPARVILWLDKKVKRSDDMKFDCL